MADEQRQALASRLASDEDFRAVFVGAESVEDAVAIAREHGLYVTAEDVAPPTTPEVSDSELERMAGGKQPSMDCDYTTPFDMRHQCGS